MSEGLVVLDTSILLRMYLYRQQTRQDLVSVLSRINDQLWVPHQVVAGFWANREPVMMNRRRGLDEVLKTLEKKAQDSLYAVKSWAQQKGIDEASRDALTKDLSSAYAALAEAVVEHSADDGLDFFHAAKDDPVIQALGPMLSGRVGTELSAADHGVAIEEAARRTQEQIPPGYLDRHKSGHGAASDYVMWEQILREAQHRSVDVLLVTGDLKEDWWRRVHGELVGPRVELCREFRERTGRSFAMVQPDTLLRVGREMLGIRIDESSVEQAARLFEWLPTTLVAPPSTGGFALPEAGQ
ncbi:PIN-like domain-containing protein [Kitasatospora sp. NPDC052896]|uniref:PIN-like domain-containing protein n=1 Tax=Kitasatospora sp. NPDC052896 TaxID=3364061 RepID=UPI0037C9B049